MFKNFKWDTRWDTRPTGAKQNIMKKTCFFQKRVSSVLQLQATLSLRILLQSSCGLRYWLSRNFLYLKMSKTEISIFPPGGLVSHDVSQIEYNIFSYPSNFFFHEWNKVFTLSLDVVFVKVSKYLVKWVSSLIFVQKPLGQSSRIWIILYNLHLNFYCKIFKIISIPRKCNCLVKLSPIKILLWNLEFDECRYACHVWWLNTNFRGHFWELSFSCDLSPQRFHSHIFKWFQKSFTITSLQFQLPYNYIHTPL